MVRSLIFLACLVFASPAIAHDAQHLSDWIGNHHYLSPTGKGYCCGQGDCGVMEDGAVHVAPGGYNVHGRVLIMTMSAGPAGQTGQALLTPGARIDEFWPANEVQLSEDDHFWRCAMGTQYRCVFIPPNFSMIPHGTQNQNLAAID